MRKHLRSCEYENNKPVGTKILCLRVDRTELILNEELLMTDRNYTVSQKGCHPNHGYNLVSS